MFDENDHPKPTREQLVAEIEKHGERVRKAEARRAAALRRLDEYDEQERIFRERMAAAGLSDHDPVKPGTTLLVTGYGTHMGRSDTLLIQVLTHTGYGPARNRYQVAGEQNAPDWRSLRLRLITQGFTTVYVVVNGTPVPLFPRPIDQAESLLADVLVTNDLRRRVSPVRRRAW